MIYIVKHKEVETPKLKGYKDIGTGDLFKGGKDNIEYISPYINEMSAMYDIWKNKKDEIKGQIQYRKHLAYNGEMLKYDDAKKLLEEYDMITTIPYKVKDGIYHNLRGEIGDEPIKQALDKYYRELCEIEPELYDYFNSTSFHYGNLFICKKEIYDAYCEWFFPIIIPLTEQFVNEDLGCGKRRMMGYIGERLFTYWVRKHNLKVKELDVVIT